MKEIMTLFNLKMNILEISLKVTKKNTHTENLHQLMLFLASSKLIYSLEAPTIQCELVEEFWSTAE